MDFPQKTLNLMTHSTHSDSRFATHFWPGLGSSGIAGLGGIGERRVRRKTWRLGAYGTGLEGPGTGRPLGPLER